jgi:hypothetical protein
VARRELGAIRCPTEPLRQGEGPAQCRASGNAAWYQQSIKARIRSALYLRYNAVESSLSGPSTCREEAIDRGEELSPLFIPLDLYPCSGSEPPEIID